MMLSLKDRLNRCDKRGLTIRGYNAADLEAMTSIPKSTFDTWRSEGKGPHFIKIEGKKVVYPGEDFETWWRRQEEASR